MKAENVLLAVVPQLLLAVPVQLAQLKTRVAGHRLHLGEPDGPAQLGQGERDEGTAAAARVAARVRGGTNHLLRLHRPHRQQK